MKKGFSTLLIVLIATFGLLAQDAESIINSFFEKNGGKANIENISSMQIVGSMTIQGMTVPFEMKIKDPDKQKMDLDIQGQKIVSAYDGETAWSINPMAGQMEPTKVTGPQAESMKENNFEEPFLNFGKEGHSFAYEGDEEQIDGKAAFEVSHTKPDGNTDYHFIEKETYTRLMTRSLVVAGPAAGNMVEVHFSDVKPVGDHNITFPHGISAQTGGQEVMFMEIESYTLNEAVADSVFAFPDN